jgi:hypothetical protein
LEPGFSALFESYPADEDRLTVLLEYYSAKEFKKQMADEADEFSQGPLDIMIYYNKKITFMGLVGMKRDNPELIEKIKEGLLPADAEKLGYDTIPDLKELHCRIMRIAQQRAKVSHEVSYIEQIDALRKEVELLKVENANFVNYEGRGRRGRGARAPNRGGRNNNNNNNDNNNNNNTNNTRNNNNKTNNNTRNNNNINPDGNMMCVTCNLAKANMGYKYCMKCHLIWKASKSSSNHALGSVGGGADLYAYNMNMGQFHSIEGDPDGPDEGISIDFSSKTKYLSIEVAIGDVKNKELVMIDSGASISLVEKSIPYLKEEVSNSSIRFGNGTTQVVSLKRLICIYVDMHKSCYVWCYVMDRLPTKVILGTDFLNKRAVIDLMANNIRLFNGAFNCSEVYAAAIQRPEFIEGTKFRYAAYPFMRDFPLIPKGKDPDYRSLMLEYIIKFDELEKRMGWVHNEMYVYPISIDPSAVPVHLSPIIYNGLDKKKVEDQIREWWENGVIRRSNSPWAHQVLLSEQLKPADDGFVISNRVCPNLIPINSETIPMSYPLPNPRMIINNVVGKYKSILDCSKGYLRFKLREEDKEKTAFIVQNIPGLGDKFEFNFMPWGAMNAGRFYQEKIDNMLRPTIIDGEVFSRNLKG